MDPVDLPVLQTDVESESVAGDGGVIFGISVTCVPSLHWYSQSTRVSQSNVIYPVLDRVRL